MGTKERVKRVILDIDRCIDCRSCEVACFYSHVDNNNLPRGEMEELAALPTHCRHCDLPACASVCPVDAIEVRDDGIVWRQKFKCIGCKSCVFVCPFGAISLNIVRHVVSKCDLCCDLVEAGGEPRCVSTCPANALSFEAVEADVGKATLLGSRVKGKTGWRR